MYNWVSWGGEVERKGCEGKPASKKISRALDLQILINYAERRRGGLKKGRIGKDS